MADLSEDEIYITDDPVYAGSGGGAMVPAEPSSGFLAQALNFRPRIQNATPPMSFPEGMASNFPSITFSSDSGGSITLPAPTNIEFRDSGQYNQTSLGALGKQVSSLADKLNAGFETDASLMKTLAGQNTDVKGTISAITKEIFGGGMAAGADAANNVLQSNNLFKAASIGAETIFNPNMVTEYTGQEIRVFTFAFKLMPRSKSEANIITSMISSFRKGAYPQVREATLNLLYYPPKWKITLNASGNLPKFGPCYLQTVTTAFNNGNNTWSKDKFPMETDIGLTFIETKAHTLDNINDIDKGTYSESGGLSPIEPGGAEEAGGNNSDIGVPGSLTRPTPAAPLAPGDQYFGGSVDPKTGF